MHSYHAGGKLPTCSSRFLQAGSSTLKWISWWQRGN